MSRLVIHDIVIPVVERIMREEVSTFASLTPENAQLEEFLQEEMTRYFGVIGANDCQHLREQLEEAKKNDPYAFEFLTRRLSNTYVKLAIKLRSLKHTENQESGPPDRFSEQRRRYLELLRRYRILSLEAGE